MARKIVIVTQVLELDDNNRTGLSPVSNTFVKSGHFGNIQKNSHNLDFQVYFFGLFSFILFLSSLYFLWK